jgi:hypothetical protein
MGRMKLAELTFTELMIVYSSAGYQSIKLGIVIGQFFLN